MKLFLLILAVCAAQFSMAIESVRYTAEHWETVLLWRPDVLEHFNIGQNSPHPLTAATRLQLAQVLFELQVPKHFQMVKPAGDSFRFQLDEAMKEAEQIGSRQGFQSAAFRQQLDLLTRAEKFAHIMPKEPRADFEFHLKALRILFDQSRSEAGAEPATDAELPNFSAEEWVGHLQRPEVRTQLGVGPDSPFRLNDHSLPALASVLSRMDFRPNHILGQPRLIFGVMASRIITDALSLGKIRGFYSDKFEKEIELARAVISFGYIAGPYHWNYLSRISFELREALSKEFPDKSFVAPFDPVHPAKTLPLRKPIIRDGIFTHPMVRTEDRVALAVVSAFFGGIAAALYNFMNKYSIGMSMEMGGLIGTLLAISLGCLGIALVPGLKRWLLAKIFPSKK